MFYRQHSTMLAFFRWIKSAMVFHVPMEALTDFQPSTRSSACEDGANWSRNKFRLHMALRRRDTGIAHTLLPVCVPYTKSTAFGFGR